MAKSLQYIAEQNGRLKQQNASLGVLRTISSLVFLPSVVLFFSNMGYNVDPKQDFSIFVKTAAAIGIVWSIAVFIVSLIIRKRNDAIIQSNEENFYY